MGTWAAGNFDNDSAMDFVGDVMEQVAEELKPAEDVGEIDLVMAAVAMSRALVEHCHAPAPTRKEIDKLKNETLKLFDEEFEKLEPAEGHQEARRAVIVETFDGLLALLEE